MHQSSFCDEFDEALRAGDALFRTLYANANIGIAIASTGKRFLRANRRCCEMLGYLEAEIRKMTWADVTHPDDLPANVSRFDEMLAGKVDVYELDKRFRRRDGALCWAHVTVSCLREPTGEVRFVLAFLQDITERKRAEAALLESEAKFRGIAERSFDIIHLIDAGGRLVYVSPAVQRVLGYSQEEAVGRHFRDFVVEDDLPVLTHAFSQHMQGIETGIIQIRLKRQDGQHIAVEINSSQVLAAGKVVGIQGIIRDVTSRLRFEEKLHKLEEQISHMARLSTLGELIAGIAHELNQPLYTIQNTAKACRNVLSDHRSGDADEVCGWCDDIAKAAAHAGTVVKALRGYSRRTGATRERVGLREILDESVNLVAYEARRRHAVVELDLGDPPPLLEVNRIQIQQVLVNLLRNACEAVDTEGIERRKVTVRSRVSDDSVVIAVEDTGPGLPVVLGAKIFEPFVTTKPEGLGLGLSICTTIVESHGGTLDAFSNRDGGAVFQVQLPILQRGAGHAS